MEPLFTLLIDVVLGALLGVVGGLFGIGGGLIAIPVLALLFGLDQQLAQGTALVMVVPNVLLSVYKYNQRNRIDWQSAGLLAAAGMLSALVGTALAVSLDARSMRHGFVGFLFLLVLYNLWQLYRRGQPPLTTPSRLGLGVLGLVAGMVGGLFGVGGAVIATPILAGVMGLTQVAAQGMSLAMALPTTGVTLASYAWHGEVDWSVGIPLALGGLLSVSWGVKLAHQLPERLLRLLFCGFLLLCAVLLALR